MSANTNYQIDVKIKYLDKLAQESNLDYATENSAGIDLIACFNEDYVEVEAGERHLFSTGIAIQIESANIAGFLYSRSGLGAKKGMTISQGVGVIDPDYRGEIKVSLLNTSNENRRIKRGERIAQLVFMPFYRAALQTVTELSDTARGDGGFGHTGK